MRPPLRLTTPFSIHSCARSHGVAGSINEPARPHAAARSDAAAEGRLCRSLCGSSASSFRRAMGARARLARCRPGPQRPSRMHQERVAARHAHASGVHGRRGGVAGVWPVQPGLVLRAHGAARAPDRAVALEAAAKGDLPDAVPALDALRSGGSTERSGSGPTTCLRGRTVSP